MEVSLDGIEEKVEVSFDGIEEEVELRLSLFMTFMRKPCAAVKISQTPKVMELKRKVVTSLGKDQLHVGAQDRALALGFLLFRAL